MFQGSTAAFLEVGHSMRSVKLHSDVEIQLQTNLLICFTFRFSNENHVATVMRFNKRIFTQIQM